MADNDILLCIIALFLPPLAVFIKVRDLLSADFLINLVLFLFGTVKYSPWKIISHELHFHSLPTELFLIIAFIHAIYVITGRGRR